MNIVCDANIIIAALLGSRATLTIITSQNHSFYAPRKIVDEIMKHRHLICERGGQSPPEFDENLDALLVFINVLEYGKYKEFVEKSTVLLESRDKKDADYLACAFSINADFIWTNDEDFSVQKLIRTRTTQQFIDQQKM